MPGYEYGENNTAFGSLFDDWDDAATLIFANFTGSSWDVHRISSIENIETRNKVYRTFDLGNNGDGSPTTEAGNNEHSKKMTISSHFNFEIENYITLHKTHFSLSILYDFLALQYYHLS